jgi:hypothetical protein
MKLALAGKVLFLQCLLSLSPLWACSFHVGVVDLFFELGSTALTESSKVELGKFVSRAENFHYIDFITIQAYTGYELISSDRLQALAVGRSHLAKTAVSSLKARNERVFVDNFLPFTNRDLHAQPEKNARVEIVVHGWSRRPIEGKWCGIACPCFEPK